MHKYLHPRVYILLIALLTHSVSSAQIARERFRPQVDPTNYPVIKFDWNIPGSLQVVMNEGLTNLDNEKYSLALVNFSQVLNEQPNFWPASYYRGVSYRILQEHLKAKDEFLAAIKLEKTNVAAHYLLAETYFQLRSFDDAEVAFRKVIKMEPSHARAYYGLANVNLSRFDFSGAEKYYEKSTEIDPSFAPGFIMQGILKIKSNGKKNERALTLLNRGLAIDSLISEGLFWRGMLYLDRRDYVSSLRDWNNLVFAHPNDPYYLIFRSFLHIELKDFDRAFNDLKKAVLMQQLDVNAYTANETALDKQIELQNAAAYVARFSYGMNNEALKNFKKGFCYFGAGRADLSNYYLKLAEKIEPSATIYYMRAVNYDHNAKHDSAHIYYDKALQLDNEIVDAHKKRAIYRFQLEDWNGSYHDFDEMLRLDPTLTFTYRLRGFVKGHQRDYQGCVADLTRYIETDSADIEAYKSRAACRGMINDRKGQLADYGRVCLLNPDDRNLLDDVLREYDADKDTAGCFSLLRQFIKTSPDILWYRNRLINHYLDHELTDVALREIEGLRLKIAAVPHDDVMRKILISEGQTCEGRVYFIRKEYEKAIQIFDLSIELDLSNLESKYYRALCYLELKQRRKAIEAFESFPFYRDAAELLKKARKLK